jgi:hypothetical protein
LTVIDMEPFDSSDSFDEEIYLMANPDVAAAVKEGAIPSGRAHYDHSGRREGRIANAADFVRAQSKKLSALGYDVAVRDSQIAQLNHSVQDLKAALELHRNSLPVRLANRVTNMVWPMRVVKAGWWLVTGQFPTRYRHWRMRHAEPDRGVPHFAPPEGDFSFAVPFGYEPPAMEAAPGLAVILHMYYPELLEEFKGYLSNIPFRFDLFITTDDEDKRRRILAGMEGWERGAVEVRIAPNRGRDIAPKLIACRDVYDRYEFFLHIHSKKSPQLDVLSEWRPYLLETLLGSEAIVRSVFEAFVADPKLGMVAAEHFDPVRHQIGWGWNFPASRKFAEELGIRLNMEEKIDFPSGSMFWGRSAALRPLLDRKLQVEDFPEEAKQLDGTLGHVIERMYFFVCEKAGFRWLKVIRPHANKKIEHIVWPESAQQLRQLIADTQYELLPRDPSAPPRLPPPRAFLHQDLRTVHAKSDLRELPYEQFCAELEKHVAGQASLIDFDEKFYRGAYPSVAREIETGGVACGYVHYCLAGQYELRLHSDGALAQRFGLQPNHPQGFLAPVDEPPRHKRIVLDALPDAPRSTLLILFSHLQEDLFFAGYSEFFKDYAAIFPRFERVVLAVATAEFDRRLAAKYYPGIEVIHMSALAEFEHKPHLVVAFNAHLTCQAQQMLPSHLDRIVYYCQDFESGFFPFGMDYVIGERAVANTPNLVLSTELLKKYFEERGLVKDQRVFVTSPRIDPFPVKTERSKRLFFYYRPELFHKRNLPEALTDAAVDFCERHKGYEIYMVGSVATSYSYKLHGTQVYVISKLPKDQYIDLISSCDVVVSMIYAAHPGVIAYQAAASGMPTVTNVFDNRDAALLRRLSDNLVPYDPVRQKLVDCIEEALAMPKGRRSWNPAEYTGPGGASLVDFHDAILKQVMPTSAEPVAG